LRAEVATEVEGVDQCIDVVARRVREIAGVDDRRRFGIGGSVGLRLIVPRERGDMTAAEIWKRQPLPSNGREAIG
jgi:hypothetical protein